MEERKGSQLSNNSGMDSSRIVRPFTIRDQKEIQINTKLNMFPSRKPSNRPDHLVDLKVQTGSVFNDRIGATRNLENSASNKMGKTKLFNNEPTITQMTE
jgi:hypothetical protein